MLGQYLPVVMLFVLGVLFALLSLCASRLLAPNRSTPVKSMPYECGVSGGDTRNPIRFPVKFFLVAMIFIVFDIEVIFLYPYALVFDYLGTFGLVAIGIFSFAVFESFVYLISNGALEWGRGQASRSTNQPGHKYPNHQLDDPPGGYQGP